MFGPRGVGKTTWLKQKFPQALYFDLLSTDVYTQLLGNPSLLEKMIPENFDDWVVIDEVQRIPVLLNEVHRLIENRKIKFILTGSSARSLRRKGVNLLAGRAFTGYMHPLTAIELGGGFNMVRAACSGMLPNVWTINDPSRYLAGYVGTYLKEEVQQEALTRNLALFTRFLATASFSQGEELNYTAIAREIGSNRQTVSNFFDVLEDMLLSIRLPVFRKRAKRELVSKQKFYYFDAGVYQAIRPKGPLDTDAEIQGAAFETLLLQHLRAVNDYYDLGYDIYYWRTRSKVEVDFVLYGEKGLFAFEIKRKQTLQDKDFKGLKLFLNDYPVARNYMVYNGSEAYHYDGVEVIPFEKILFKIAEILQSEYE